MVPISAQAKDLSRRPTAQELHRTRDQTHREILPRQNASANCTYRYKGRTGHTDIRARGIIIIRTYVRYVAVVCPRVLLGVETRMFWWTADDVLARSGMSECKSSRISLRKSVATSPFFGHCCCDTRYSFPLPGNSSSTKQYQVQLTLRDAGAAAPVYVHKTGKSSGYFFLFVFPPSYRCEQQHRYLKLSTRSVLVLYWLLQQ